MVSLGQPWALALAPVVALCSWRMLRRTRGKASAALPLAATLPSRPTLRQRLSWLPPALFGAGLFCGVVALARPREQSVAKRETKDSVAIEMAVDVSGSMAALDFATDAARLRTRLDVVKETFRSFVEKRPDDLVGLVAFGGYATTRCPLTLDHDALFAVLGEVAIPGEDGEPVSEEETATAIGDGLVMACARLASATNVASRVVVLLSDGENNYGIATPQEAAALAKHEGIKVYTVGVGSNGVFPALWRSGGSQRIVQSQSRLDERTLRAIAEATGGRYFNVRSRGALDDALSEIDKLERTEIQATVRIRHEEKFAPWLAASAALCAAALIAAGASRRALI